MQIYSDHILIQSKWSRKIEDGWMDIVIDGVYKLPCPCLSVCQSVPLVSTHNKMEVIQLNIKNILIYIY